ncbi:hypothetical protein B566_EDAN008254 [Ephemera danica]|nr:hypothetical protein B566_EDAN008254 [Ephemera danica]
MGEIPLISRQPPLRTGPGGESNAIESWEQAPELSQLGQILSCRAESRRINPLYLVISNAESLVQMGLEEMDLKTVNATLKVLECTGYIFAALGHYWLAMKCWTVLFDLAKAVDNAEIQLIAELMKTIKADSFVHQFYSLSHARSLMLSNRNFAAIDIVLSVWKQSAGNSGEQRELQIRAKLLASQLMVRLPVSDSRRKLLKEEFQNPMSAAYWAFNNALIYTNVKYPAGCYKMAVNSMQLVLQKLQNLMYCSRVAQILACLGDIDLMTPDKSQLDQRLFWNQKILSLGTAIVGGKDISEQKPYRTHTVGTSPTRFQSKKHQLTAACSIKCSKTQGGCTLCKNPLYQLCKVHYAFLVEDNEDTVLALCKQLDSDFKERADRLWMFTWKRLLPVDTPRSPQSVAGWLHLLVSPITLLECRQKLAQAAVKAAQSRPEAASLVSDVITKLQDVQHETVPLLLGWANSQLVATLMQNRAVSMIVSKFCLNPDSSEETWLLQHTAELMKTIKADSFVHQFYSLSHARSLMLSNRNFAAIDIVLSVWKQSAGNSGEQRELQIRAKLLASQLMVRLPVSDSRRKLLKEEFQNPMSAAYWAFNNALIYTNVKYPAGCYKMAVNSMQLVLQKLQNLMYCSRVAQILACLGDIDLMTPDKSQLDQRLFWNQKILSLGTAIVGGKDISEQKPYRTHTVGTSPTRFQSKKHQLTAACSIKCSKTQGGCTLCKNPLYQLCKVHYAFLVEDNEDTVLALCKQLDSDFKERADRLWMFTWKRLLPVDTPRSPQSVAGWLHLLVSPITLLECRQKLAQAAVKAAQSRPEAASLVSDVITKLQDVQHETVPLLLGWANSQLVATLMQNRGLGEFASKLKAPPMLPQLSPTSKVFADVKMDYLQVEQQPMPPPRTPTPPPVIKKPLPKRPGRRPARKEPEPSTPICASLPIPKLVLPDTPKVSPAGKSKKPLPKRPGRRPARKEPEPSTPICASLPIPKLVLPDTPKVSPAGKSKKKQNPETPVKSNSFKSPLKQCNGAQESPIFSAKSRRPVIVYSDTSPDSPVVKKATATKEPGKVLTYSKPSTKKTEAVRPSKKLVESPIVKKIESLDSSTRSSSSVELIESSPPMASCKRKTVIKSRLVTTQSQDPSSDVTSKNLTSRRKTVVKSRLPATKSHDSSSEGSILESSIVEVIPKRPTRAATKRVK